jgi:hypothetical protein
VHLGSAHGRARPARLAVAQPTWLVAQRDGNMGRRSATAAVGNSGKPTPEVGGEQELWHGGGVADHFKARKRLEGGSPKLSTVALTDDRETAAETQMGGRGGRQLGRGAVWRCTGARGRVS